MSELEQRIADMFCSFAVWYVYEDTKETSYGLAGYNAWIWRTTRFPGTSPVCDYCAALNGTVWKIGDPNAPPMPAHLEGKTLKTLFIVIY